ncbi:porin [Paraburkholderia sp. EG287B]|uniref:porin n=1 Tax=Paraburkholderia sp. EG287B TaxID=3237010 RepID=UPI0034D2A0CB
MKKSSVIAISLAGAFSVPAFAQNSVTLYGIIDAGITYTNNAGGHSLWQAQSGIAQGSRWGLKGTEELGGGTNIIFQLESGFNAFNGALGQGGLLFGRQAYVGVTNATWGTLTLGRQYDPIVDIVQPTTFNGQWGALYSHPSDIDNTDNGFRVNNAVKYVTPTLMGFSAEAMYAFGGVAGSFGQKSTIAAGASYSNGPLYVGAAYFYAKNPATQFQDGNFQPNGIPGVSNGEGAFGYVGSPSNMQVIGAGVTYTIGQGQVGLNYTNTRFDDASGVAGNTVTFDNYEIWGQYHLTTAVTLGGGYTFTEGKVDYNGARPKYNQFNLVADYLLSKRTDVYLTGVYQRSSGGANAAIYQGLAGAESSTTSQVLARIGIRHKF